MRRGFITVLKRKFSGFFFRSEGESCLRGEAAALRVARAADAGAPPGAFVEVAMRLLSPARKTSRGVRRTLRFDDPGERTWGEGASPSVSRQTCSPRASQPGEDTLISVSPPRDEYQWEIAPARAASPLSVRYDRICPVRRKSPLRGCAA